MITEEAEHALTALEGRSVWAVMRGSNHAFGEIKAFGILEMQDEWNVWKIYNEETGERFGFFARSVESITTMEGLAAIVFPGFVYR